MATLIASAKLTNAFRIRVVDKNVSAALTSSFSLGNQNQPNPTLVNGVPTVFANPLVNRTRRTVSDLESSSTLANTMRYATKGGKGEFAVSSSLVCEFPTYIEIDIEALMLQGLPEGTDCVLSFQEGWMLEDRGRLLPSGAYEYGSNTQDAPSPEFPSFVTFRTPKFFRSAFSSVFSLPARTALRIKQLQSAVASVSTFTAVAIFNPGKFAALFAGVSQAVTIARKTVVSGATISSIVNTITNNTRVRQGDSAVSSQFTLPPIDFWYRRLGVSLMSSTATISAAIIRNIGPITADFIQGVTVNTTALKKISIIKNLTSTISFSVTPTSTRGILSLPMSMTSSMSVIGDVPMILTTTGTTVGLPLWYGSINAVIDWGDGTTQSVTSTPGSRTNLVKNYATSATRTIYIKGFVQNWGFANADQFLANTGVSPLGNNYTVQAFGAIGIQSLIAYSANIANNGLTPVSIPDSVLDISYFYYFASSISNPSRLQYWNTSNIQKMEGVFRLTQGDLSALPITGWNTGSVTTMKRMFRNSGTTGSGANFNADISGWDVSNVQNFNEMFRDTPSFNRDLSSWDVSSGTDFSFMFAGGSGNVRLHNWNLSSATSPAALEQMLYGGYYYKDLTSWCVPNVASRPANFAPIDMNNPNAHLFREPIWGTCAGPRPIISSITANTTSINEGQSVTFTVTCSNITSGTVYWRLNRDHPTWENPTNSGVTTGTTSQPSGHSSEFTSLGGGFGGTLTLSGGTASLTFGAGVDTFTEQDEFFRIDISTVDAVNWYLFTPTSTSDFFLGASPVITINSNNT